MLWRHGQGSKSISIYPPSGNWFKGNGVKGNSQSMELAQVRCTSLRFYYLIYVPRRNTYCNVPSLYYVPKSICFFLTSIRRYYYTHRRLHVYNVYFIIAELAGWLACGFDSHLCTFSTSHGCIWTLRYHSSLIDLDTCDWEFLSIDEILCQWLEPVGTGMESSSDLNGTRTGSEPDGNRTGTGSKPDRIWLKTYIRPE